MENATTKVSIKIEGKEVEVGSKDHAKWLANQYFLADKIKDFSGIPTHVKLASLQKTPKQFIKLRKINSIEIPYIDHVFAQKALNFIFNFNVSTEIVGEIVFDVSKDAKAKEVYECRLIIRFKFYDSDSQKEITRDVVTGHKAWENIATSKADCVKSAMSKSWTIVAKQFGIGADIHKKEEAAYGKFGLAPDSEFTDVSDLPANEAPLPPKRPNKVFDPAGADASGTADQQGEQGAPILPQRQHVPISSIPSTPSF